MTARYPTPAEGQPSSCFARMLDVRGYVLAARAATVHTSPGAALAMMGVFGIIALVLLPLWITFDLASTWEFTTGARQVSEAAVYDLANRAGGILGMSVASALAGFVLTSFTLLPSLFELAFPTVQHPLLNMVLVFSIVFDYVTDWGKAWDTASAWATTPALQFLYTAGFCLFVSVGVQALLAVCVTVIIYAALAIIRGPTRDVQRVITLE